MHLIKAVADLRPRCIAIALSLIRVIGCAIRPGQDMCHGFCCYGGLGRYETDFKTDFMRSVE
jgi:hypothetical protein